jgi:serralysin
LSGGVFGGTALFLGVGPDTLDGGAGDDVVASIGSAHIIGGAGKDFLVGSVGFDTFVYRDIADSGANPGVNSDRISNFDVGTLVSGVTFFDTIDLSAIDANSLVAGNQAFVLRLLGGFTHTAGEIAIGFDGILVTKTYVFADVNGDAVADFSIQLEGALNLTPQNFIL